MNHIEAIAMCEEYYAENGLDLNIGWEDSDECEDRGDYPPHRIIYTVVKLADLSALSMRLYEMGWVPWEIEGVMSKFVKGINVEPIVCFAFAKPLATYTPDAKPL